MTYSIDLILAFNIIWLTLEFYMILWEIFVSDLREIQISLFIWTVSYRRVVSEGTNDVLISGGDS